ncbi:BZ3500_MvSof-1268-A1-R1_Chr1-1g00897 [Microbotryum saponariae]|uniref:BZ3500_MvSof-1268-A1-R1_Chr1-1g00897 protein n=1 Tax=Microbotryum saponariae TaxID=289078 RepID=A0A2X0KNG0_9BASI|nr:BZ3500_MvSof-1268-A1-R1_Chr1-1g00897 [Microbotryum saponariae]SCZ92886.1 BZ3501_MvSof-1269-A2-R1_Chr1-1g00494 [Microbotryum saponariae]
MASMVDDFAATTTIGERVAAPTQHAVRVANTGPQAPLFGVSPKLEPFCLLAKSARGAGAAALVAQATAAPSVYVFGELLAMPSIQDLATSEGHASSLELLKIFAYGTWSDYQQNRSSLPELGPVQEVKLRHLTIVSLAMQARVIAYSTLLSTLELDSIPKLEDLLIEGIYAGVFDGRLDQHRARIEITSSIGRDVRSDPITEPVKAASDTQLSASAPTPTPTTEMEVDPSAAGPTPSTRIDTTSLLLESSHSIASMTNSLSSWLVMISSLLTSLDHHLARLTADGINDLRAQHEHDKAVQKVIDENGKDSTTMNTAGTVGKGKERERRSGAGVLGSHVHSSDPSGGGASSGAGTRGGGAASLVSAGAVGRGEGDGELVGDMDIDSTGPDAFGSLTRNAKNLAGRLRKRGRT